MLARLSAIVAVDIGSRRVRIATARDGLLLDEPAVVAGTRRAGGRLRPRAAGYEAILSLRNAAEGWEAVWPCWQGTVHDEPALVFLIRRLLRVAGIRRIVRAPAALLASKAEIQQPAGRLIVQALRAAGFGSVLAVPSPVAALLGAEIGVLDTRPWLVIDVGTAETRIAVVSPGSVHQRSVVGVGVQDYAAAVHERILRATGVLVPDSEHELTRVVAATVCGAGSGKMMVRGVDRQSKLPRTDVVDIALVKESLSVYHRVLSARVCGLLDACPERVTADLGETGCLLHGGGARIPGLAEELRQATGLPVFIPDRPDLTVVEGLCRCVMHRDAWGRMVIVDRAA